MSTLRYTPLDEITAIHATVQKGYRSGKTKSIAFRKQQLLQLCYMLDDNKDRFRDALASDLGRSAAESNLLELSSSLTEAKYVYDNVEKWAKPESAPWQLLYFMAKPTVRKESKGVIAIIVPFNYPVFLTICPVAGAIASGNAFILKPSELIPATSALFEELVAKYLDPSLYRVVNGSVAETTHLLTLQWDHISYTGNGQVARIIAAAAAKQLTPITLELGGKSPVFVDPKCDFKSAAKRILWGKCANAGQTCVAPDYVIIPKEGVEDLIREFKAAYLEFYPDGPANTSGFCRIVNDRHFQRLKGLLDHTNGTTVIGGETDATTKYIAPTIVRDVAGDDSLMSEELFGPILPIISVNDLDEAIEFVNARDHPLALYVFTQDSVFKNKVINNTQSGSAIANDVMIHCVVNGLPIGGTGPSGSGYFTGKYSFDQFTHLRGTMDNPRWIDIIDFRFPPLTEAKNKQIKTTFPRLPPRNVKTRWGRWFLVSLAVVLSAYLTQRKVLIRDR